MSSISIPFLPTGDNRTAMKRLFVFFLFCLLAVSCVENPDNGKEEPPVVNPTLSMDYTLVGSYSAEFVCTVGQTDRLFIGGGFLYSKDPGFAEDATSKALGMVLSNVLSCTVSDLEPESHYYVKAFIFDMDGQLESDVITFDSPSFNVQGETDFHLPYGGGTVDLTVIANEDFQVYSDADWITGVDTRSASSFSRTVSVQPNTTLYARSATLSLESQDSYFRETVTVVQDGAPASIPDAALKAYLVAHYDADGSSDIELAEIPSVTEIVLESDDIRSLQGLELFSNLEKLVCRGISGGNLEKLDLSNAHKLITLDVSRQALAFLDISACPQLKVLDCSRNSLRTLDLSHNEALEELDCSHNNFELLDLEVNHNLRTIHIDNNGLTTLKTPRSESLAELTCAENKLEKLDLVNNRGLNRLDCSINRISALNVSTNSALVWLDCSGNALTELSVWRNDALETLLLKDNVIVSLDLSKNALLKELDCRGNQLKTLDLSANPLLESVDCSDNLLFSLDVSMLQSLKELWCNCPEMAFVLASLSQRIKGVTENRDETHMNAVTEVRYTDEMAVITDPSFLAYLVKYYDSDGDGLLSRLEADKVTSVHIDADEVETLDGLQYLTGLKYLQCEGSNDGLGHSSGKITSLDLSHNPQLEQVLCGWNRIEKLDVSGCPHLKTLWCYGNRLKELDLSGCPELLDLNCEHNLIESLNLSRNTKLVTLDCSPMAGENGLNLLSEVRIPRIRIEYVNGSRHPRNSCCIPPRTDLYIDGSLVPALPVPFMFDYNAKDFSVTERAFINAAGAQWHQNMALNGSGFRVGESYVHINQGIYAGYQFPSREENPFNRRGMDELTIIAKVKGERSDQFSIFANRSETSDYNFMFREGDNGTRYFYLHDSRAFGSATSVTVSTLPNIVVARVGGGKVQLQSITDGVQGLSQPVSWGGESDAVYLFHGGCGDEYWTGDFYWIYLSLRALSDEEIKQVVDYNEF